MSQMLTVNSDDELEALLSTTRLGVVVEFVIITCEFCINMAPFYEELSKKYPLFLFVKANANFCVKSSCQEKITQTPTFILYWDAQRMYYLSGAAPHILDYYISLFYNRVAPRGQSPRPALPEYLFRSRKQKEITDLTPYVMKSFCKALNESKDHPLQNCLEDSEGFLLSEPNKQLVIYIQFSKPVHFYGIYVKGPNPGGPARIKIFVNHPIMLNAYSAARTFPDNLLNVVPKSISVGETYKVNFTFEKFYKVRNVQLFVSNNFGHCDVTRIDRLYMVGKPDPPI